MIAVTGAPSAGADTAYGTITTEITTQSAAAVVTLEGTEAIVREYFADIPVMINVARCESTFRHTDATGTVLRGKVDQRDTGVMQINTFYHGRTAETLGLDLENIYDNMAYARHLYEKQGVRPWSASAPCWGGTLAYNQ